MNAHNDDELSDNDTKAEGDENQWKCQRCSHDATTKGNLLSHLRRKVPCTATDNVDSVISIDDYIKELTTKIYIGKVYECQYCNSKFTTRQAKYKHKFSCKAIQNEESKEENTSVGHPIVIENKESPTKIENENLQATINEQRTLINYLQKELEMIKNTQVKLFINIISNNNVDNKKYKKKKISHAVKISCWNTHVGELIPKVKCLCCHNVDITQHNFHCGHIVAECNGGTYEMNNLLHICNVCNSSMGSVDMNEFRSDYGFIKK
jgi:hypothetical protein